MIHESQQQAVIDECLNESDVLEELAVNEEFLKRKEQENCKILFLNLRRSDCPRCGYTTKTSSKFPYCSDCNWDYLDDSNQTNNVARAA